MIITGYHCEESTLSQPSVKKNFIYRTLYEVLVVLTPFITTPYIARVLGSTGVGISSYTHSVMAYFTMFAALGTPQYGVREIARHRDNAEETSKLFWEIELLTVFTSGICLLGWVVLCFAYREYTPYLFALTPLLLGTMVNINWYFTGHEKVLYTVIRNAACKVAGIIILFTCIKTKEHLFLYILLNSIVTLLGNLSMWTYLPNMLVKVNFHSLTFRRHFRETLVYFVPTVAISIYHVLDKTLLGLIVHNYSTSGFYDQAHRLYSIINSMVFTSLNAVMEARVSYLFAQNKTAEIKRRIRKAIDFTMLAGFGCVFGVVGITKVFVPIFWGPGWDPIIPLIYLMAPLTMIISVSYCLGSLYYNPSGNRAQSARYLIIGACINLVLNLLMIPRWKAAGAIIATIIAESAITTMYTKNCKGYLTVQTLLECSWCRLLAGAAMSALVMAIGHAAISSEILKLAIQIIAGTVFYVTILYLAGDALLKELIALILHHCKKITGKLRARL